MLLIIPQDRNYFMLKAFVFLLVAMEERTRKQRDMVMVMVDIMVVC